MNKVILYIATSLYGLVVNGQTRLDWLMYPDDLYRMPGYSELMKRVSSIVMGNYSYKYILEQGQWLWPNKQVYIFTTQKQTALDPNTNFVEDDPRVFMDTLRNNKSSKDVLLLGGSGLIKSFAAEGLIDECIITIFPIAVVNGVKVGLPLNDFELTSEKQYASGIAQKIYQYKKKRYATVHLS